MNKIRSGFIHVTVFFTGAAILLIEIIGTSVVAPFYGWTTVSWSALIAVTLGALAAGYAIGGRLADKNPSPRLFYTLIAASALFVPMIMKLDQPALMASESFGHRYGPLVAAILLFTVPLFLLGMISPFAIRLRTDLVEDVGKKAGSIFAFSTLGSLTGAVASGFILVPLYPISKIFNGTALCLLAIALIGLLLFRRDKVMPGMSLPAMIIVMAAVVFVLPKKVVSDATSWGSEIRLHTQSFYGDIKVVDTPEADQRCLLVGGTAESCMEISTGRSQWGYVPKVGAMAHQLVEQFQLEERSSDEQFRIGVLGLGGGNILAYLPEGVYVDVVEIEQKVVDAAREFFGLNPGPDQNLHVQDARYFFRNTPLKYDLIVHTAYSAPLFTKEFLELLKDALTPDGLLVLEIESSVSADNPFVTSMIKTSKEVFPSVKYIAPEADLEIGAVVRGEEMQGLSDSLLLLSQHEDFSERPFVYHDGYLPIELELGRGLVVTDDYNPYDSIKTLDRLLGRYETIHYYGGYQLLFAS